jgi:hypothetical protein
MIRSAAVAFTLVIALSAFAAAPIPTPIVIRVVAHDGKILGKDAGGADVRIYDATTHKLLAGGTQNGEDSGDNQEIMETKHLRSEYKVFAGPKTVSFSTTLPLRKPTRLEIVAEGPLGFPASKQRVSKTLWVLPGHSMDSTQQDGILLELYGFAMKFDSVTPARGTLSVVSHVAMMCGCPIKKDGPWPESQFKVVASLQRSGGAPIGKTMTWNTTDTFEVAFDGLAAGHYELVVTAADDDRANFSSINRDVVIP